MDYYINKYITQLNNLNLPEHKHYEVLCSLENKHILWDDIPPDFCDKFDIPHAMDYGVDTINLEYTQTGQAKHYNNKSLITWSAMTNFRCYSSDVLEIDDMLLFTNVDSKIDKLVQKKLIDTNIIKLIRKNYSDLLKKWSNVPVVIPDVIEVKEIEERDYLLDCYNIINTSDKEELKFQLPCGTGKSYIMLYTVRETLKHNPKNKYIIFCPWKDLAYQTYELFKRFNIKTIFIGDGNHNSELDYDVIICINMSIDYIPSNVEYKYIFIDEAHHMEQEESKIKEKIKELDYDKLLLFTATFKDEEEIDYDYSIEKAEENGYITPYKFNIEYFTDGNKLDGLIKLISGKQDWFPALIYFNNTERTKSFNKELELNGIKSTYITGDTPSTERNKIKKDFKNNKINIICLCGCWNEAISIDEVQSVIFGDLRHSDINKIQIAMRGNRIHNTKPFYRIVLPLIENDFNDDNLHDLLLSFSERDSRIKKAIENKSISKIKVNINNNKIKDKEIYNAEYLYEEIYDRMGNILEDNVDRWLYKLNKLEEYINKNNKLPSQSDKDKEIKSISKWLSHQKENYKKKSQIMGNLLIRK